MIRKNLIKSLSVIMAAMLAIMTVACGQNTVETSETAAVTMETEQEQTDALAETMVSASNIASAESSADKVETVYVTADANGAVNDVIVSEWLKNAASSAALDDTTELKNIVNVKGSETFKDNGDGTLTWDAEGSDIYYQGTTDKQLPVTMKITYTLDGKEISPEELAGKSGKVTIRFEYENNSKQTVEVNGKDVEVYTPFAMVSGMMLDADKFANVEISNGKVISDGGKTIVMGVALPGLKESLDISEDKWDKLEDADDIKERLSNSFEITADTTDFELGMTITMASSDILSDFGMTDLSGSDKLTDLKDDMEELNDGSNKLVDGAGKLKDGTTDLTDGTKKLYDGAVELKDGTQKLYDGSGTLASGAVTLSDGVNKYTDGVSKVHDGADKLADGAAELHKGTSAFVKGLQDAGLSDGTASLSSGAEQLSSGLKELNDTLAAKSTDLAQQLAAYKAIDAWLDSQGTLKTPEGVSEATMNECLSKASKKQITSVAGANYWMTNQVIPSQTLLESVYSTASSQQATSQTIQTSVQRLSESDLFGEFLDDENDEEVAASVTSETPVPAGEDNKEPLDINTIPNPDPEPDKDDDEEVAEPTEKKDEEEKIEEKKDEEKKDEEKKDEEKKSEEIEEKKESQDETKKSDSSEDDEKITKTTKQVTSEDEEDEEEEKNLNSLKTMIVTKKIVTTNNLNSSLQAVPADKLASAKQCVYGYYKMCGSAAACEVAVQESISMFTTVNPQTKMNMIQSIDALYKGSLKLSDGAGKFKTGIGSIYGNVVKLDEGAAKLSSGASDLADGTRELDSNSSALRDGADKLAEGAGELYDGAGKLNDGTGELKDGTKELYDGSVELDDGVKQLFDGITKFDDEGIKKIYEAFDGDLSDFTDRLEAIQEAGSGYKTFGGSSDDVDSSVKFIIKTDSIKSL